jgi:hypothetical protein
LQAPDTPGPGYTLRRTKGGGYAYEADGWRAEIAPDGAVTFTDRTIAITNLRLGPLKLIDGARPGGDRPTLQGVMLDLLHPRPPRDPWEQTRAPISRYHADPRAACLERDACAFVPAGSDGAAVGLGGTLDLTDMYMRWLRQDPYRRAKARFLAATQDLRARMSARRHADVVRGALAELPARLAALWQDTARAPVERRQLLWLLWSEATDPESGAAARAAIERFIRERLPPGNPDAFTDAELARFGVASAGAFAPYSPPPAPPPPPAGAPARR